jgi:aryl-alcohol dehydrogenase-like predicted oxidoreductase
MIQTEAMHPARLPKRAFGKTGIEVTITGLGGEGVLRTYEQEDAAQKVIREAIDQGISYFDSARAYAGSETYYGLVWPELPEKRTRAFQASKSAKRDKQGALADLEQTLGNMGIDHLDLWQIHDVRTEQDLAMISRPGGALEAFVEAKTSGKTRFIGVTGHHDPRILTKAIRDWPVDSVMIPINPVEAILGGFMDSALLAAMEREIAVIGMKVLGASHYISPEAGVTPEMLIRFALSQPISVAIVGCSNVEHVRTLAASAQSFSPLSPEEQQDLIDLYRPYAKRLAYYRGVI